VHWYLAHDPTPLPHLFRILWPFWFLRDRQAEARPWVEELLPAASSFDPNARAELEWTATVVAASWATTVRRWRPVDAWSNCWKRSRTPSCMQYAGWSWARLRRSPAISRAPRGSYWPPWKSSAAKPFWTAVAAFTAGAIETALGHPDSALQHLRVMRELADRYDYAWLIAISHLQLGTLAVAQGRLEEAREQMDEALELSLAIRIIRNVTRCLAAFAQLTFAEGDPERAALLAGAAEGLRRRAGFSTLPTVRRGEAQLSAQIRQALGDDRFGQVFAAGSRLSQQEAVAAIRDRPGSRAKPA
jgi:tetratricopeptide (TPR) repeat protein